MFVRIANREDPDQTGSALFVLILVFEILEPKSSVKYIMFLVHLLK